MAPAVDRADRGDAVSHHRQVASRRGLSGPIHDQAASNDEIEIFYVTVHGRKLVTKIAAPPWIGGADRRARGPRAVALSEVRLGRCSGPSLR
jgi:hypothetical protein